uniref:F-box domain-containing protein n=1 Tax=Mycena chlorophos TaxID=658473 RepID=A0ABQ0L9D3_MYCCL|nr:predicted protein [Mycena chlorophos]
MHPALGIAEIGSLICTELRLDGSPEATCGLAALARACRALGEPALDALWFQQDTMVNLLKIPAGLLPAETRACSWEADIRFSRIPSHEDALSMGKYARRIRELSFPDSAKPQLIVTDDAAAAYCAFAMLLLRLGPPPHNFCLFPNLRVLHWNFPAESCYTFLSFFATLRSSPRLHCLALREYDSGMKEILLALPTRTNLTTLSFDLYPREYQSAAVPEEISQLASSLHNIRVLCLVNPAINGLDLIARLRYLEELTLKVDGPLVSSSNAGSMPLPFVTLRHLTLMLDDDGDAGFEEQYSAHKMDYAVDFLRNCNPLQLFSFELRIEHIVTSSLNEILAMLVERVALPLQLETVTVVLRQAFKRTFDPEVEDGTSLRSLFRFRNLCVLRIELSWGVDLGDELLRELAKAFPLLEILSLSYDSPYYDEDARQDSDSPPRPKTSLVGLVWLADWCRNLRELTITMDFERPPFVHGVPPLPEWILRGRARRPLKRLNTADSRIGDAPWLALWFLAATFGQLEEVRTLHVHEEGPLYQYQVPRTAYLEGLYEYGAVWQRVGELLPAAQAVFSGRIGETVSIEELRETL